MISGLKMQWKLHQKILILTLFDLLKTSAEELNAKTTCQPVNHHDGRDELLDFFRVSDGYDITWLHAVNNPSLLDEGLSSDIMMLEADVLMRNNVVNGTPVMAHPPNVDSNLTLAEFLTRTTGSTKGIKLDFKTIVVVEPSLKMIQNLTSGTGIKNPIWLNADILPGPCYDDVCVPVDHERFLSLCETYFPSATLSISWTTGYNVTPSYNFYNWSQVLSMGKLVTQISQPITFPIRASLVKRSWKQIQWLLDLSETFTVTIWSSVRDSLDVQDLVFLRDSIPDRRTIYYDLPPTQSSAFKEALDASYSTPKKDSRSKFPWNAVAAKSCEDVLIGGNSVMFSGDGGFVISKTTILRVGKFESSALSGVVSFIKIGGTDERSSINVTLHARNPGEGTTLMLHSNGEFQLFTATGDSRQGSVPSSGRFFKFEILEKYFDEEQNSFQCDITVNDGGEKVESILLTTGSKPEGDHITISSGTQSDAVLVQNVEFHHVAWTVSEGSIVAECHFCVSVSTSLSFVLFVSSRYI